MLGQSLKHLSAQLSDKKISSVELTTEYLSRIQSQNSELNAFITVNEALSLEQARKADQLIARGNAAP